MTSYSTAPFRADLGKVDAATGGTHARARHFCKHNRNVVFPVFVVVYVDTCGCELVHELRSIDPPTVIGNSQL